MKLTTAVFGLVLCLLQTRCKGQTITITEHVSACSASYSATFQQTTTLLSTATVSPVAFTDSSADNGMPFVVRLSSSDATGTSSWLLPNGSATTNVSMAGQFELVNGQLMTLDGAYFSTSPDMPDQLFAASSIPSSISTTFSLTNGIVAWSNPAFLGGQAQFYSTFAGPNSYSQLRVRLTGQSVSSVDGTPTTLYVEPGQFLLHSASEHS